MMFKKYILASFVLVAMLSTHASGLQAVSLNGGEAIIENFNTRVEKIKNGSHRISYQSTLGKLFGAWNKHDYTPWPTQICRMYFSNEDALGKKRGKAVELYYDVDSPEQAYNGFYIKLNGQDFSAFDHLNIYIRGDEKKGYPQKIKLELKDKHQKYVEWHKKNKDSDKKEPWFGASHTMVRGITDEWKKFSIPLANFRRIKDWTDMHELVIVFEDIHSKPQIGTIYIDEISLSKETPPSS